MGTHAELTALGGVNADVYSLPLRLSRRITVLELSNLVRDGGTPGGVPPSDGGSALADVAGAEGTGGDYGGRGAENDVLEHVLCLEGG